MRSFFRDEQGQDLIEYTLLLAFLSLLTLGIYSGVAGGIQTSWGSANRTLAAAGSTVNPTPASKPSSRPDDD